MKEDESDKSVELAPPTPSQEEPMSVDANVTETTPMSAIVSGAEDSSMGSRVATPKIPASAAFSVGSPAGPPPVSPLHQNATSSAGSAISKFETSGQPVSQDTPSPVQPYMQLASADSSVQSVSSHAPVSKDAVPWDQALQSGTNSKDTDHASPERTPHDHANVSSVSPSGDTVDQDRSEQSKQLPIRIDRVVSVRQSGRPASMYSQNVCNNCGTTNTPLWRRGNRGEVVCNACGLYLRVRNASRPAHLKRQPKLRTAGSGSLDEAPGSCPGDGRCNGTGGTSACDKCPAYNNRVGRAQTTEAHGKSKVKTPSPPPKGSSTGNTSNQMLVSCQNCGTVTTPLWRRDNEGHIICNACGLYLKMHHQHRPVALGRGMIKRRKRAANSEEASWVHEHVSGGDCCGPSDEGKQEDSDTPQASKVAQVAPSGPLAAPVNTQDVHQTANQQHIPMIQQHQGQQHLPAMQQQRFPEPMMMPPRPDMMRIPNPGGPNALPPPGGVFPPAYPMYGVYYPTPMVMQEHYNMMSQQMAAQRVPPPIDFTNSFKPDPSPEEGEQPSQSGTMDNTPSSVVNRQESKQNESPQIAHSRASPAVLPSPQSQPSPSQLPVASTTSTSHTLTGFAGKGGHVALKRSAEQGGTTASKSYLVEDESSPLLVLKYLSGDSVKEYLLAARRHLQDKVDEHTRKLEVAQRHLSDCDKKLAELE